MNLLARNSALTVLSLGSMSCLYAATPIGDDATLYVTGSAQIEHQSNIFRAPINENAETVFVLTPGVEFRLGESGASETEASVNLGVELRYHMSESDLNAEHIRFSAMALNDTGVMVSKGYLGFNEYGTNSAMMWDDQLVEFAPGVVEYWNGVAGGEVKYRLSDQTAISGGIDYFARGFQGDDLSGTESIAIPVKVFFTVAPEVEALLGYRYRTSGGYDLAANQLADFEYTDHYFFVGVQGEVFSPLWTVDLDVGFQSREVDAEWRDGSGDIDLGSSENLSFSAKVNYDADENLDLWGKISRDFGQSASGSTSYERTRLSLGGDYLISELWKANFSVTWAESSYDSFMVTTAAIADGREETVTIARFGLNYYPNEYLTVGGSYQFTTVDVDNAATVRDYNNNTLVLSASVRY